MSDVQERFKLQRELGGGTFGKVFQAYDQELHRTVAIKIPHNHDTESSIIEEAELLARLQELREPHIVFMFDLHTFNGKKVIVMEYVEGQNLRHRMGRIGDQRPLPISDALEIAIQACLGLHAVHTFRVSRTAHGGKREIIHIFHRDIKPENILIREEDNLVKIADFGISTILERTGFAYTVIGSHPYMAPELLTMRGADQRADIYAMGVTLFEMLAGRLPFHPVKADGSRKHREDYTREIIAGSAPPLMDCANVDAQLSEIVMQAFATEMAHRYQTAAEFRQCLAEYLQTYVTEVILRDALGQKTPAAREHALQEFTARYPTLPEGYRQLAWSYNTQRCYEQAIQSIKDGIAQCPEHGELLVDLANIYMTVDKATGKEDSEPCKNNATPGAA